MKPLYPRNLEISNDLLCFGGVTWEGWSRVGIIHLALWFEERQVGTGYWGLIWREAGRSLLGELVDLHAYFLCLLQMQCWVGRGSGHHHDFMALQNSHALSANSNTKCSLSNRRGWVAYDLVLKNWNPLERFMATFRNHNLTETLILYSVAVIVNHICYISPDHV